MRKFISQIKSKVYVWPELYKEEFQQFFEGTESCGSVKTTSDPIYHLYYFKRHQSIQTTELSLVDWSHFSIMQPIPPIKDFTLDSDDVCYLKHVYSMLIGINVNCLDVPHTVERFSNIKIGSILYGSLSSRTPRN